MLLFYQLYNVGIPNLIYDSFHFVTLNPQSWDKQTTFVFQKKFVIDVITLVPQITLK